MTTETLGEGSAQYHCDNCGNDFTVSTSLIEDRDPTTGETPQGGHPGQRIAYGDATCPKCGSDNVVLG